MPEEHYEEHPTLPYEEHPVPRDKVAYFFAGHDYEQPAEDWAEVPHGNLPFCTTEQWREVGPFPPMHYGTDCFFYKRAKALGYRSVARQEAVAFNYNAQPGRSKRSEERRVGKGVDLGGRRIIKKKKNTKGSGVSEIDGASSGVPTDLTTGYHG